jgi:hypothetical protein
MESTKNLLSNQRTRNILRLPRNILTQFLFFTLLLLIGAAAAQTRVDASGAKASPAHGGVIVRPRKVMIQRSEAVTRHSPNRKSAALVYPVVIGITDLAVLARVRSALDIKNAFGYSLGDYREDTWLDDFGYEVHYNADYLLDITFTQNGLGAYPNTHQMHMLISLRDGNLVKAREAFEKAKLDAMAELVNRELRREISRLKAANLADMRDADERQAITDAYENLKFERQNLDEFSVSKAGITFLYDAGFPHVIKALEPQGRYFFSYPTLKDYIRRDGPLAKFRN